MFPPHFLEKHVQRIVLLIFNNLAECCEQSNTREQLTNSLVSFFPINNTGHSTRFVDRGNNCAPTSYRPLAKVKTFEWMQPPPTVDSEIQTQTLLNFFFSVFESLKRKTNGEEQFFPISTQRHAFQGLGVLRERGSF